MAPKLKSSGSRQTDESSPLLPKDERVVSYHGSAGGDTSNVESDNGAASLEQGAANQNNVDGQASMQELSSLEEAAKRIRIMYPILAIGPFLTGLDYSYTMGSSAKISSDLGGLSKSSWIATAYFLGTGAFQPIYGKLSDIFGRKPCYMFGYFTFCLGCLLCGLARSMDELIVARGIQGLGASGVLGIFSLLLTDAIPPKERAAWQGVTMVVSGAGAALGAPVGGFMADTIGWRWSFLGQAPIILVILIIIAAALKPPPLEQMPWRQRLKRIDFLGSFLFLAAVTLVVFGLDKGGNVGWSSKWTYVPFCIGIPLFALFAGVEAKFAVEPIAPAHVVLGPSNIGAYACNIFNYAAFFGMLFYVPRYLQAVQGVSSSRAGALILPGMSLNVFMAFLSGFYIKKTGKYRAISIAAAILSILDVAFIQLSFHFLANPAIGMCIGLGIYGFCNGVLINSTLISIIAHSKKSEQAAANACWYVFRALGSVTGISIASAIANQVLRTKLESALNSGREADKIARRVRDNLGYLDRLDSETKKIVVECYALSTRAAFVFLAVMAVCSGIAVWFIKEKPLSDKLTTAADEDSRNNESS